MHSGSSFNIITGQILTQYPNDRRFRSMQQLTKVTKSPQSKMPKIRLPSLGSPKDKNKFQYSYIDLNKQQPQTHTKPTFLTPTNKQTIMNYTYQTKDLITHRQLNPNFVHLNHKDFTHHLPTANAKGILTAHIDKARAYAPNFHDGFQERVKQHQFNRKQELCGNTLKIQKSYGMNRYFRKYK